MEGVQLASIVIGVRVDAPADTPPAVTGISRAGRDPFHVIDQVMDREGHGVSNGAMLDAIRNPSRITQQPNGSFRLIGKNATAVVNRAGKIVTAWARNSRGWRH
jgi:hypothetical protein